MWSEWFTGRDPAPRAWDNLFFLEDQSGWVRLKLKSGPGIGGAWVDDEERQVRSYAGGYPHPADIYLAETTEVDPDDGSFELDDRGEPILRSEGLSSAGTRWRVPCLHKGVRNHMAKSNPKLPPVQKRGGYSAGKKPISQLKPPPKGPAPGAKPSNSNGNAGKG